MHEYGVDPSNRAKVYFYLAIVASGTVALIKLIAFYALSLNGKTDAFIFISAAPIFYGLLTLFDKYLWKVHWIRKITGVNTPILEGRWIASIRSSWDEGKNIYKAKYVVKQTWSKVSIVGDFKASKSYSKSANFYIDNSSEKDLLYTYFNEPKGFAKDTMEKHNGQVRADISEDWNIIEGEYFTGRGRKNDGTITLEKLDGDFPVDLETISKTTEKSYSVLTPTTLEVEETQTVQ